MRVAFDPVVLALLALTAGLYVRALRIVLHALEGDEPVVLGRTRWHRRRVAIRLKRRLAGTREENQQTEDQSDARDGERRVRQPSVFQQDRLEHLRLRRVRRRQQVLLRLGRSLLPVSEIRFLETTHQIGLVALSITFGVLPRCPYS